MTGTEPAGHEELASGPAPLLVTEVPGPRAREHIERDARVTSPSLPRAYPLVPARGAGSVIEDVDGNRFLDMNAGIAVASTGHSHPRVVAAIREQAERLLHYSGTDFYLPIYAEVCEVLDRISPMEGRTRAFLTNSGTEAVEAAIKLARHHTGRQHVIAFLGSFHGRSLGSLSLTASKSLYRAGFGPLLPGVLHAPYANSFSPNRPDEKPLDLDYLTDVIFRRLVRPEEVAAIVVEPIQGEGGYVVPPPGWLGGLRDLCDRHGIVLVADEVQSGMGRTGKMWAIQHWEVEPDVLLAGKGIASGLPLGAMVAREDLMTWTAGAHGSTFGGNPLSCAAALATTRLIEGGLMENAARVGAQLMEGLRGIQGRFGGLIEDVRGVGLMIGVELSDHETADAVEQACFRRGLLTLTAGDSAMRLSPPLVLRPDQAETALGVLEAAVAEVAASVEHGAELPSGESPAGP
ncbi:MAG: acetyl ornithine aminotransferase family protein [Actinobacteria bacterium]|nr:acetyl ornithine aminotransferase family protein [Actinomycetota bacterium]